MYMSLLDHCSAYVGHGMLFEVSMLMLVFVCAPGCCCLLSIYILDIVNDLSAPDLGLSSATFESCLNSARRTYSGILFFIYFTSLFRQNKIN